ncbi:MAG: efflux RND transporter periplasmic adaptor subunit [Parachlamydia sp.]|nr:efflux RND transporter periplasmic adaptor subunit [Parachlamydia sp.]
MQPPAENKAPADNHTRNRRLLLVTGLLLLLTLLWCLYYFLYLQYHESTDDAYANGNMISINSAVPGSVAAFFADDTDFVQEGQLLVMLDRTAYQVAYDKELAALASTVLQVRQLYNSVLSNRANVDNKRIALQKAKYDYENRAKLVNSKAVSNEEFTHAQDTFQMAELELKQAEYQLQITVDAAGPTAIEKHPLIQQQKGVVRRAWYELEHCAIYAPATGYVAQRSVDVGQWAAPATTLMAIIPTDYVWVDANFKETQLTYMRIGQPATVWFDLYGSKAKFKGKVLGIASGTGSVFSLIPPQNATGNWIKIVQRLPVRISLDPEALKHYPTRLGISAEVDVNISDQNLPRLAGIPSAKPVGKTRVFDLDFSKIDQIIDKVVSENL